jgi:short-subunit dehydrogenase
MARDLRGRRILITGASSGIGRTLAEQAARAGARLVLAARSNETLDEVVGQISAQGGQALAVPADITSEADRRRLLSSAVERLGGLDVLINNAGVASWGHFADSSEAILRQIMEVNFFAPAELIRQAVPILTRGQQPAIVNIASMCGRRGLPAWSEYSASKFALCGLSEALRGELVRFDIDVLLLVPGVTRSDLRHHLLRSEGRFKIDPTCGMDPEYVARQTLRALRGGWRETVLGWEARWLLWGNRYFPRLTNYLMARQVRRLYANGGGSANSSQESVNMGSESRD